MTVPRPRTVCRSLDRTMGQELSCGGVRCLGARGAEKLFERPETAALITAAAALRVKRVPHRQQQVAYDEAVDEAESDAEDAPTRCAGQQVKVRTGNVQFDVPRKDCDALLLLEERAETDFQWRRVELTEKRSMLKPLRKKKREASAAAAAADPAMILLAPVVFDRKRPLQFITHHVLEGVEPDIVFRMLYDLEIRGRWDEHGWKHARTLQFRGRAGCADECHVREDIVYSCFPANNALLRSLGYNWDFVDSRRLWRNVHRSWDRKPGAKKAREMLSNGTIAILHGLKSNPELNKVTIVVLSWDEGHGRYLVQPITTEYANRGQLLVRSEHVIPTGDVVPLENDVEMAVDACEADRAEAFAEAWTLAAGTENPPQPVGEIPSPHETVFAQPADFVYAFRPAHHPDTPSRARFERASTVPASGMVIRRWQNKSDPGKPCTRVTNVSRSDIGGDATSFFSEKSVLSQAATNAIKWRQRLDAALADSKCAMK